MSLAFYNYQTIFRYLSKQFESLTGLQKDLIRSARVKRPKKIILQFSSVYISNCCCKVMKTWSCLLFRIIIDIIAIAYNRPWEIVGGMTGILLENVHASGLANYLTWNRVLRWHVHIFKENRKHVTFSRKCAIKCQEVELLAQANNWREIYIRICGN